MSEQDVETVARRDKIGSLALVGMDDRDRGEVLRHLQDPPLDAELRHADRIDVYRWSR